ncbi:hypothetical protein BZG35_12695 [Brevundimonas sp. LM2]|uniref:hypothetical protein n=1 Tax=Brevundimonas sp. LM2 TaxID=1938605 RepID=UPI000983F995|nr:hypothetical protein [Brevundimonas sp. LM2]AQR62403.1 hypothetical protein BZG35_12695 [Brevundimonas sp. LM2]
MMIEMFLVLAMAGQDPSVAVSPEIAPDPSGADLECSSLMAISLGTANSADQARSLTGGLMYFLGRLEARVPHEDWPARIETHIRERGIDGVFASADRCSAELARAGNMIPAIGQGVTRVLN